MNPLRNTALANQTLKPTMRRLTPEMLTDKELVQESSAKLGRRKVAPRPCNLALEKVETDGIRARDNLLNRAKL